MKGYKKGRPPTAFSFWLRIFTGIKGMKGIFFISFIPFIPVDSFRLGDATGAQASLPATPGLPKA